MTPQQRKKAWKREKTRSKLPRLTLVRYYDLRSPIDDKLAEAASSGVTIYVNQAHTIAHVIWAGDACITSRIDLRKERFKVEKLRSYTDYALYEVFLARLLQRIIL